MKKFLLLTLFAAPAFADTMYVTEFQGSPPVSVTYQVARAPAVVEQTVAIGVSSAQSAAFNASTGLVRIHCDVVCNVKVGGADPTATTSTLRLAAGQTEYFRVEPGAKVAVILGT